MEPNSSFKKIHLNKLYEWSKNPREIKKDDFEKLKERLVTMEQIKPLLVTPYKDDGAAPDSYIVIGGNMRVRAYREIAAENPDFDQEVLCLVIDFKEEDGLVRAVINGKESLKRFNSVEDAMMEYSFLDNERSGYYDPEALANMLPEFNIDLDYAIDTREAQNLEDYINKVAPGALSDLEELAEEEKEEPLSQSTDTENADTVSTKEDSATESEDSDTPPGEALAKDRMDEMENFENRLVECPDCGAIFDPKKHRAPENAKESDTILDPNLIP